MEHMILQAYPGMTPSQLDKEDAARLLRNMNAAALYAVARKPHEKWTPDDLRIIWKTHMRDKELKAQQGHNE